MGSRCPCGSEVANSFDHLGCIQCGSACCPACSCTLESAHYCATCSRALLEAPWPPSLATVIS